VNGPQFRVWVGWRLQSMRDGSGWNRFLDALSNTFIPATWMVMRRYGLTSYVPSVMRADPPHGCPEETALLVYESRAAYDEHRNAVGGRSYSLMHGAVFESGDPSPSRSAWAETWPWTGKARRLDVWVWQVADGDWSLTDKAAQVVFVLVGHAAAGRPTAEALYRSLNHTGGQVVLCTAETFTAAWIATRPGADHAAFGTALAAAGFTSAQVQAAHVTRAVDIAEDYFKGTKGSVPVKEDETLRFIS